MRRLVFGRVTNRFVPLSIIQGEVERAIYEAWGVGVTGGIAHYDWIECNPHTNCFTTTSYQELVMLLVPRHPYRDIRVVEEVSITRQGFNLLINVKYWVPHTARTTAHEIFPISESLNKYFNCDLNLRTWLLDRSRPLTSKIYSDALDYVNTRSLVKLILTEHTNDTIVQIRLEPNPATYKLDVVVVYLLKKELKNHKLYKYSKEAV